LIFFGVQLCEWHTHIGAYLDSDQQNPGVVVEGSGQLFGQQKPVFGQQKPVFGQQKPVVMVKLLHTLTVSPGCPRFDCDARKAVTVGLISATEAVAVGLISATEAVAVGLISATEAVTVGLISATEAVAVGFISATEAVTVGLISFTEAVTVGLISATELLGSSQPLNCWAHLSLHEQ
jgi:hypothetical protein